MKSGYNRFGVMLLVVAIFLIIAMLFISSVQNHTSNVMLKQQIYEQGLALTSAISKSIWATLGANGNKSPEYLLRKHRYASIANKINKILEGTPVLKLKLFNSLGHMRYSSNKNDVLYGDGDDLKLKNKINMIALEVVKNKKPFSSYRFRETFDDGINIYRDRYIFSIYIPAIIPGGKSVGGVVEIYYDVTNIVAEFNSNTLVSHVMLSLTGFILFLLIGYLIVRNDKITSNREAEREKYLNMIKQKNKDLVQKSKEVTAIKERTEKISEERSVFMSRMSHELRAPMNAVIGLTDLVMRTNLTDQQRGYISAIQSSGNILIDITDEILTIGRLETGFLEIKEQQYILRDVIENVIEIMGNRACKQGLELFCDFTPEIENCVVGDPVRLRQVLLNLVGNAIKYTPEGNVRINVSHVKGSFGAQHYRFEVHDTGIGVSEEDQNKIFTAYCHLNQQTSNRLKNNGLGLAISKRLVEAMNGVIGIESELNKGSTFWFKLPLHTEKASTENIFHKSIAHPQNARALIVSQHEDVGNSIVNAIRYWGINADMTTVLSEAEKYIEDSFVEIKPYTLFFLDATIENNDGIKLARSIRKHTAFNKSHIIIMVPISEPLKDGVVTGINQTICINKPVLPGKLKNLIAGLIGKKTINYDKYLLPDLKRVSSDLRCYCGQEPMANKVLVVEDNPVNRELMLEMLSELNIPANAVEKGAGVIEALMDESYELILLDGRLPDMEGHEVAAKIRNMKIKGRQPVIIVTSSDYSLHNQQLCYESGVDDFLHKPIKLEELSASLHSWIPEIKEIRNSNIEAQSTVVSLFGAPILDKDVIARLKKNSVNNPEFFPRIVSLFIDDGFERIDKLKAQLKEADYDGVERSAHSIKSGCLHIGARRMAKYCEVLSNMARNQSYNETQRALQHFIEEFDRLIIELDSEQRPQLEPL